MVLLAKDITPSRVAFWWVNERMNVVYPLS